MPQSQEHIFITKNGYGDLVVMSMETYERQMAIVDVYKKLNYSKLKLKSPTVLLF